MSRHDNQQFIGIVCGGDDNDPDPQKLGRVKILVPQLHGKDFDPKKAPWCQLTAPASDSGVNTFQRPPQQGTVVRVTQKSDSGHFIVDGILHGNHNPTDVSGNNDLTNQLPWFARANDIKSRFASGGVEFKQTQEQNRTGKEAVKGDKPKNKKPPSMKERRGTPTDGAATMFVNKYKPVTNITTAIEAAQEALTQAMGAQLPGVPMSLGNLMSFLPKDATKQLQKSLSKESFGALQNTLNILSTYTPISGTNFAQTGSNVNPATFGASALNELMKIKSPADVPTILNKIATDPSISGMSAFSNVSIEIDTPFGKIQQTISPSGEISFNIPDVVQQAQKAFNSLLGGIPSAADTFMKGSAIPEKLVGRLPPEVQNGLKQALENKGQNIQAKLNSAAKAFFG